jgi:hypothetical protein
VTQLLVGAFHSATGAIKSALKNVSPDAHWIACRLVTAGGKHIKMRLLSTAGTVITTSTRQQQAYMSSVHRPASGQTSRPVSAEPARALLTSKNLQSAAFTSAPAHWQTSAKKLSQLPAYCSLNPACSTQPTTTTGCAVRANFLRIKEKPSCPFQSHNSVSPGIRRGSESGSLSAPNRTSVTVHSDKT